MGDSYEKVKMSEHIEAIRERARIIVGQEKRFPKSHRYHCFMHFVEAVDSLVKDQEVLWEGVTKMLSKEVGRLEVELGNKFELLDSKSDSLDKELLELKNEVSSKFELLDGKLDMLLDQY